MKGAKLMRKAIFKAFLVLAIIGLSAPAWATSTISAPTTLGSAANTFSPSAKVGISVTSISTSYAAGSCHLNGTFEYGIVGGTGLTGSYTDVSKMYKETIPDQSGKTVGTPTSQSSATALQGGSWE
jgi:hypothetical protein